MKKSTIRRLQIGSFLVGLGLLVYVIKEAGLDVIEQYVRAIGWGFLAILVLSLLRNFMRAGSWYLSIDPQHRTIGLWPLHNVMLAGEAVKYLTATGPLLGEPAKAVMVRERIPLLYGFSSIAIENLTYYLSVVIFTLAGLPALIWLLPVSEGVRLAGYAGAVFMVAIVGLTWYSISRRSFVLARLFNKVETLRKKPGTLAEKVRALEEVVYSFYEQRRGAFALILALNLSAHLMNVIEVYLILDLMALPASLSAGFVIEAATKIINAAFFFIPTRAGVYESGNALVISSLGMAGSAGVALAIIRKIRAFIWVAYGLGVMATMAVSRTRPASEESPAPK